MDTSERPEPVVTETHSSVTAMFVLHPKKQPPARTER
jgi:hypothetical protein